MTVRGVDDSMQDGSPFYKILTANTVSDDPGYSDKEVPNVDVQNLDNDTAGIRVEPKGVTLNTSEDGTSTSFSVVLNSQPKVGTEVTFSVTSSAADEGTVTGTGILKFTGANWNAPQMVTIKGVNDDLDDGPQQYHVSFSTITSQDANYAGDKLKPLDVPLLNGDNDTAGINLTETAGLVTTEKNAGTDTFFVALASEPTANVTVNLSSSRPSEGTVLPGSLLFTPSNWKSVQTVTITGVDDKVADGPQTYLIIFAPAASNDKNYAGKVPTVGNVTVSNLDDDTPGVRVKTPDPTKFFTSEPNGTTTFTVELLSQPTANVTIPLSSSKTSEGTVFPSSLLFTAADWNAPHTVTLTGGDDKVQDGDQTYVVSLGNATSADAKYGGHFAQDIQLSNHDDDTAAILVGTISGKTTEANNGTASFTIRLQTQPTADVSIALSSTNTKEGTISDSQKVVTFTPVDWASPKAIIVSGVDDKIQDGDQPYQIDTAAATSKDPNYNGMDAADVAVANVDNDTAAISVSALSGSGETSESGGTTTFMVSLVTQPTADVTLEIFSSNEAEGIVTTDTPLVFTSTDYASIRTVVVKGVDDDATADGKQPYKIQFGAAKSADKNYNGMQPAALSTFNTDNDSAGITVTADGVTTSEDQGSTQVYVVLTSKPKATVQIPISSSNTGEGVVDKAMLTFTTTDWASRQPVTVTGVDDDAVDGDATYKVLIGAPTTTDQAYAAIDPPDVSFKNFDNDQAGIEVIQPPTNGNITTEAGGVVTFTIKLRSKPSADVTIAVSSSDKTEGTVPPAPVLLTAANWNTGKIVTVHGEDDDVADDRQPYTIVTGAAASADPNYNGLAVDDVPMFNEDNDVAGYTVKVLSGSSNEAGGTASFSVVLNSQPTDDVSIPIASDDEGEGTALPRTSVDFTTADWSTAKTVIVHGVDDDVADGEVDYHIVLGKPTTNDAGYKAKDPPDVSLKNVDDDMASLIINMPASNMTTEGAGTVTFKVMLTSKPKAPVTLALTSSNPLEGVVMSPDPPSLLFDGTNWSEEQSVTVQGVDDTIMDGEQTYMIQIGPPDTTDASYANLPARFANLTNSDDDAL